MMCNNTVDVQRDATTLEVTELPIRKWTQDYKEFLETLIKPEDKNAPALLEVNSCAFSGSLLVYRSYLLATTVCSLYCCHCSLLLTV